MGNNRGSQTGASGPNKRTTLTITYLKKQARGKSNWSKEKLQVYQKKGKTLTLCSNLELAVGDDVVVDVDVDE